jgi:MFS-type transporter involved in bile tolerance (Atg22 family)
MYQAAGDAETLEFLGRTRSINSIVLLSNGISFALQVIVFLILGSFADFGSWRPNILICLSIVAFGIGFGWLGVHTEEKWHVGVGLYIVGLIAYQTTVTFWTAAFPGLARNTRELRLKAEEYAEGTITRKFISPILLSKSNFWDACIMLAQYPESFTISVKQIVRQLIMWSPRC